MTNIVLANIVFFYSFYAPAQDVLCEGVLNYSKTGYKLVMLEGEVVKSNHIQSNFWWGQKSIMVDVSRNFKTPYEIKNNDPVQEFNPNSCLGVR